MMFKGFLLSSILFLTAISRSEELNVFYITGSGDVVMKNYLDPSLADVPKLNSNYISSFNVDVTNDGAIILKSESGSNSNKFSLNTTGFVEKAGSWNPSLADNLKITRKPNADLSVDITCSGDVYVRNDLLPFADHVLESLIAAVQTVDCDVKNFPCKLNGAYAAGPSIGISIQNEGIMLQTENNSVSNDLSESLNAKIELVDSDITKQSITIKTRCYNDSKTLEVRITSYGNIEMKNERGPYLESIVITSYGIDQMVGSDSQNLLDTFKIIRDKGIGLNVNIATKTGQTKNKTNNDVSSEGANKSIGSEDENEKFSSVEVSRDEEIEKKMEEIEKKMEEIEKKVEEIENERADTDDVMSGDIAEDVKEAVPQVNGRDFGTMYDEDISKKVNDDKKIDSNSGNVDERDRQDSIYKNVTDTIINIVKTINVAAKLSSDPISYGCSGLIHTQCDVMSINDRLSNLFDVISVFRSNNLTLTTKLISDSDIVIGINGDSFNKDSNSKCFVWNEMTKEAATPEQAKRLHGIHKNIEFYSICKNVTQPILDLLQISNIIHENNVTLDVEEYDCACNFAENGDSAGNLVNEEIGTLDGYGSESARCANHAAHLQLCKNISAMVYSVVGTVNLMHEYSLTIQASPVAVAEALIHIASDDEENRPEEPLKSRFEVLKESVFSMVMKKVEAQCHNIYKERKIYVAYYMLGSSKKLQMKFLATVFKVVDLNN